MMSDNFPILNQHPPINTSLDVSFESCNLLVSFEAIATFGGSQNGNGGNPLLNGQGVLRSGH